MSPDLASPHPGFLPYAALRQQLLGLPAADWIDRCSDLARQRGLHSVAGAPIRFVTCAGSAEGALGYEAAILREGRVGCRPAGRGALHDLHNALVWLTFPRIKATLNRLHLEDGVDAQRGGSGLRQGRGRARDAVTLLDENGLLWLSGARLLDEQLVARNWRGLLVSNRARVQAEVLPVIIGHGLLEKLAVPYKSMTAQCLICPWPVQPGSAPSSETEADGAAFDYSRLDTPVAACIDVMFSEQCVLTPLPVQGLPGWDRANIDPSYYDDPLVFRPQKNHTHGVPDAARLYCR